MIFAEYDNPSAQPETAGAFPVAPPRPLGEHGASVAERGVRVGGPFLAFWEAFGQTLCGLPLTDEILIDGVRSQVFDNLVLEEHAPGRVRPAACGAAWLALAGRSPANGHVPTTGDSAAIDLVGQLPTASAASYASRTLADIRYLVVHHTGAPIEIGPRQIAEEHVNALGWPGIGYHFVVGADGTVWRTQDLTTTSHHARQFNPVSVGIALVGDLTHGAPPPDQLDGAARLVADLADRLGLPLEAVRGHGEMVPTACPGEAFLDGWKAQLLAAAGRARRAAAPAATLPLDR